MKTNRFRALSAATGFGVAFDESTRSLVNGGRKVASALEWEPAAMSCCHFLKMKEDIKHE